MYEIETVEISCVVIFNNEKWYGNGACEILSFHHL